MTQFSVKKNNGAGTPLTPHRCLPVVPCTRVHRTGKLATEQSRS